MNIKSTIKPSDKALGVKDELVTRGYLDGRFDEFARSIDKRFDQVDNRITQVEERLETKIEAVDKKVELVRTSLIDYIDHRLEPFEEMRKDFYSFKDQVLTSLDWLMGAFKKFDEEHTVLTANYTKVQKRLDNHEERLYVMETGEKYNVKPKK